jgi:Fic/DOC family
MTTQKNLAIALRALMEQQKNGFVINDDSLSVSDLKILKENGFLSTILRGWSLSTRPTETSASTQWHASFWEFAGKYLQHRNGDAYCLNAESSLSLQTGSRRTPPQMVVMTDGGGGQLQPLPFDTSMLFYPLSKDFKPEKELVNTVLVMSTAQALVELSSRHFFLQQPEVEIALAQIQTIEPLWRLLWNSGKSKNAAAERIVGALRFIGRVDDALNLKNRFKVAGVRLRDVNPFTDSSPLLSTMPARETSPYALRLRAMWAGWRQKVIDAFPTPSPHVNKTEQLKNVDERHKEDAYHSLSIEGYKVTTDLIEKIENGTWDPENQEDKKDHDAMAASGYYRAFLSVRKTIESCFDGKNPGAAFKSDLSTWYYELFSPSVDAGILKREQLYGFRTGPVFIRTSKHTPLPKDALLDGMGTLFDLLTTEPEASVRAVLGHHLFVFIHPYFDGNGRIGRFLMNVMLSSGGYPWAVVKTEEKNDYMSALEAASANGDIQPFANFVAKHVQRELSIEVTPIKPPKIRL